MHEVRVAANMVALKSGGVVFAFEDGFAQQNEGPGREKVLKGLPVLPDPFECLPCALGRGAV